MRSYTPGVADPPIETYSRLPAAVHEWDPRLPAAAAVVVGRIRARRPDLVPEHIGSSAVPGLPGKNVIDLAILAEPEAIPGIGDDLLALGFQRQGGPDPMPPTRPLFLGEVGHDGARFRIHCHVIPKGHKAFGDDYARDLAFRDALLADPALVRDYAAVKRRIVEAGTLDSIRYSRAKTEWIRGAMERLGIAPAPILPPATIGILGGGQLGRMMAIAGRSLGYRAAILDPDPVCPAAAVADEVVVGRYDDVEAAVRLAERADVVTYELEHVSAALVDEIDGLLHVRPGPFPLRVTQDRLAERHFLDELGVRVAEWREVRDGDDLRAAARELGFPLRLKASIGGYDGRSQVRIATADDLEAAVQDVPFVPGKPWLVEREIDFDCELSVVCARAADGRTRAYPPARNRHDEGILVESVAPAPVAAAVAEEAAALAERLAVEMGLVGLLTVELFLLPDGSLAVNELAPRVHNSGHWTIEGAVTSQFEQHVRAITGLPLGSVEPRTGGAATVNLLGTGPEREARPAGLDTALGEPDVHVHLYDKRRVFERRKMGHVTALAATPDAALERARAAAASIRWE